jgi:hypothetical protein
MESSIINTAQKSQKEAVEDNSRTPQDFLL